MREIAIDSKEIKNNFAHEKTVKEIVDYMSREYIEKGEVLCEIVVDGEIVDERTETRLLGMLPADISSIAVKLAEPEGLAYETLGDSLEFLASMESTLENTIDLFRQGEYQEAHNHFIICVESVDWVTQMIVSSKKVLGIDYNDYVSDEDKKPIEANFVKVVHELLAASEQQDWILLTDILEYELLPFMPLWHGVISEIIAARQPVGG